MSHDLDPSSGDLLAVAQPTLPPPPNPTTAKSSPTRRRIVVIAGVVIAAAVAGGAAFASSASHHDKAKHSAKAVVAHPPDLAARVEGVVGSLPRHQQSINQPCTSSSSFAAAASIPLVVVPIAEQPTALVSAVSLANVRQQLPAASRIAVVQTVGVTEPHASVGVGSPGRYEGQLVIVDASNGALLCHTRIVAWSSSIVEQPGVSERVLRDDFDARVRSAFSEAAARLHVELEL